MFGDRSWVTRAGVALMLLLSMGASTIALPHVDADADAAWHAIGVTHNESAHHIRADPAPASTDAEHCFLCHSLRTFYPPFDKFEQHHSTPNTERLHFALIDRATTFAWTLVPGRAPPV